MQEKSNDYEFCIRITLDNAKKLIECGADILVSGSHVFKAENPKEIISKLKYV